MEDNIYAHETRVIDYDETVKHIPDGEHSYVVIMTHGHRHDQQVLAQLATREYAYLGMIGSQAKVAQVYSNLEAAGFDRSLLARVRAPIGIDIGSHRPAEIAISIAAEIVKMRNLGS
jgi:xanthine dehydrogenase accessory factor